MWSCRRVFEKGDKSAIPTGTLNLGEVRGTPGKWSDRDMSGPRGEPSVKRRAERCAMDPTHTPPLHLSNLLWKLGVGESSGAPEEISRGHFFFLFLCISIISCMSQKKKEKRKPFILYPWFARFKHVETRLICCPCFHLVSNMDGTLTQVEYSTILS